MLQFAIPAMPCSHCMPCSVSLGLLRELPPWWPGIAQSFPSQQDVFAGQLATASGAYKHTAAKMHIHAANCRHQLEDRTFIGFPNSTSLRQLPHFLESGVNPPLSRLPSISTPHHCLDLPSRPSQTSPMAHTYMKFDFGADEETAQQARHKLDTWKQAFRLDKKLQYKLDRGDELEGEAIAQAKEEEHEEHREAKQAHKKHPDKKHSVGKPKAKPQSGKHDEAKDDAEPISDGRSVTLLVRLYFSSHEKLSEQRWFDRIPSEEPFKSASPQIIRQGQPEFEESQKQFADLE
jgi:hypothetical protein